MPRRLWASDPWTHGSYAAFEPGQYTRYWGFVGRPEGRVLFGGEHTCLSAQGFLEGAVRSGERCAREAAALTSGGTLRQGRRERGVLRT